MTAPTSRDLGENDRPGPVSLRLVAAIIDYTLQMVVVVGLVTLADAADLRDLGNGLGLAVLVLYPVVSVGRFDRTLGKRACNLVVRSASGGRPGWGRSIVRFIVGAAPLAASIALGRSLGADQRVLSDVLQVVIAGIVYAPIVFDPQRRGLHDVAAGTRVICTAPPVASVAAELAARIRATDPPGVDGR